MLSGPWATVILCTIVLLFQGTFMAHGGFTTLGANVFSMGIAGPFVAYALYKFLTSNKVNPSITVFAVVFVANIVTYLVTSLQLALIVPYTGISAFVHTYTTFFGIFTVTQIPIATAEGVMMVFFFKYLADVRPDLVKGIGYDTSVRNTRGILSNETKEGLFRLTNRAKTRLMIVCFAISTMVLILLAYLTTFFADIGGADDAGAGTVTDLIPGYQQLAENYIQLSELHISFLFIVQTAIGILILALILRLILRKKRDRISNSQEET
jgi:ABC-type cobalt transport system substrate-binding protein